jgi:hypothetical protein
MGYRDRSEGCRDADPITAGSKERFDMLLYLPGWGR